MGCHPYLVRPQTVYKPHERPDAEVYVEGTWYHAEIRMWSRDDAGGWHAQCTWHKAAGETRIDTFPAHEVRPVEEQPGASPPTP